MHDAFDAQTNASNAWLCVGGLGGEEKWKSRRAQGRRRCLRMGCRAYALHRSLAMATWLQEKATILQELASWQKRKDVLQILVRPNFSYFLHQNDEALDSPPS